MSQYKVHAEDVECFVYNLEKLFGLTRGVIVHANPFIRKSGQASFQLTYRHPVGWTICIGPIRRLKRLFIIGYMHLQCLSQSAFMAFVGAMSVI